MKKKTRDLKKHYRGVEYQVKNFEVDLSEDSWCRMWHEHLDWYGVTLVSYKHRKIHIMYYLKIIEKIELETKGSKRDFQTWIYLDKNDGTNDAIYFHTDNPEGNFPFVLDNVQWNIEVPTMLMELLDLSKFNVGIIRDEKGNVLSYIIQKKGLGLEIGR
ncbi:hypothetical protein SDC9_59906 [bioreactor metagenome]|uniref:Uncharacterized protein n=1 Tax=bioreactor metagenome TaxID=1076179 RepID=A0A644XBP9_9ZZZZ